VERVGWLRAAVLGANDRIISTSSLALEVATAQGSRSNILAAAIAGLLAAAMAMAAGTCLIASSSDSGRLCFGCEVRCWRRYASNRYSLASKESLLIAVPVNSLLFLALLGALAARAGGAGAMSGAIRVAFSRVPAWA
jgi:VIT1/CCC1 family predicted Fe2+/Mn2+ transporter